MGKFQSEITDLKSVLSELKDIIDSAADSRAEE